MKLIRKFILSVIMAAVLSVSAFAESGFEFMLNVPLGLSVNMTPLFNVNYKVGSKNSSSRFESTDRLGFDAGISVQIGYMFQVKNNFGISLLADAGYSYDSFLADGYKYTSQVQGGDTEKDPLEGYNVGKMTTYTHNFKIGILPKFNINAFSIGIGLGVIVPMAVQQEFENAVFSQGKTAEMDKQIPVGFYGKLTFDYSIFFTEKIALNVGLYTGVDFIGMTKTALDNFDNLTEVYTQMPLLTYDIGLQVAFRFGPKAF